MDISQAPEEITIGELYKEIVKKKKVANTKEKLPRGKELKPFKELGSGSTKKKLPRRKAVNPFKEIAKKEKVVIRKKKLPIKSTTREELCAFYTPEELCDKYTPTELRWKFGLPKLSQMLPRHRLALMVFPRPIYRIKVTEDGNIIELN